MLRDGGVALGLDGEPDDTFILAPRGVPCPNVEALEALAAAGAMGCASSRRGSFATRRQRRRFAGSENRRYPRPSRAPRPAPR